MTKSLFMTSLVFLSLSLGSISQAKAADANQSHSPFYPIDTRIADAKESYYSNRLHTLLNHWPPAGFPAQFSGPGPIWFKAIPAPKDNSTYIGVAKQMLIKAPISRVLTLMKDYSHYKDRSPDLKEVKQIAQDGNKITTYWNVNSPSIFIPNTKFEQVYIIDESKAPNRVVIRYQFKSGNHINSADGIFILDAEGETTRMTGVEFLDANWSILKSLGTAMIWRTTLEKFFRGDVALKLQAENPKLTAKELQAEAQRLLNQYPVEPIQYLENFSM